MQNANYRKQGSAKNGRADSRRFLLTFASVVVATVADPTTDQRARFEAVQRRVRMRRDERERLEALPLSNPSVSHARAPHHTSASRQRDRTTMPRRTHPAARGLQSPSQAMRGRTTDAHRCILHSGRGPHDEGRTVRPTGGRRPCPGAGSGWKRADGGGHQQRSSKDARPLFQYH